MPEGDHTPPALARLSSQPQVRRFLSSAVTEKRLSHAYLFLGAPGSGKLEAACALAQCIVCPQGGCGSCDECIRVSHGTHPDVRVIRPDSAQGYLIDQVRALMGDVALAPVRAQAKVYIFEEAGLLRDATANALLKTIEEPPSNVVFILIARSADSVLPTIASRCQHVPFAVLPSAAAIQDVELATGIGGWEARAALAITATPRRAAAFLASSDRRALRRLVLRTMGELERDDSWDVLRSAREIVATAKAPLGEFKARQGANSEVYGDYLSPSALRRLEEADKRALNARERSAMMEVLTTAASLLRDVLLRCEDSGQEIVNEDVSDVCERMAARTTVAGVLAALAATDNAASQLEHNVTPQLVLEAMLLEIKEALYAHRHSGEVQVRGARPLV